MFLLSSSNINCSILIEFGWVGVNLRPRRISLITFRAVFSKSSINLGSDIPTN